MDWKKLLSDLQAAGYTQTRIAERCEVSQSTVSDLARGATKQPSFDFGSRLLALKTEMEQAAAAGTTEPAASA